MMKSGHQQQASHLVLLLVVVVSYSSSLVVSSMVGSLGEYHTTIARDVEDVVTAVKSDVRNQLKQDHGSIVRPVSYRTQGKTTL